MINEWKQQTPSEPSDSGPDRREWLSRSATAAMFAGLGAGYGTFARFAGKFLFTSQSDTAWLFVAPAAEIAPGQSLAFEAPTGARVTITRRAASATSTTATETTATETASTETSATEPSPSEPALSEFSALSSVCPHLGCQVHWEAANHRYFCPCHNGVFDPEGRAVEGPPAAARQELPRYSLHMERGLLFVALPLRILGDRRPLELAGTLASEPALAPRVT